MPETRTDCPTDDFSLGKPNGKCWGDGHYLCDQCMYFEPKFVGPEGKKLRDEIISMQGQLRVFTAKN
jgi:hypothetical protein